LIPRSEFILPQPKRTSDLLSLTILLAISQLPARLHCLRGLPPTPPEHHPNRPRLDFLNGNTSPRRRLSEPANTRLTRNWNTLQKAQSRKQPNLDRRKSLDPRQIRAQG
jgi:hypothetical protein